MRKPLATPPTSCRTQRSPTLRCKPASSAEHRGEVGLGTHHQHPVGGLQRRGHAGHEVLTGRPVPHVQLHGLPGLLQLPGQPLCPRGVPPGVADEGIVPDRSRSSPTPITRRTRDPARCVREPPRPCAIAPKPWRDAGACQRRGPALATRRTSSVVPEVQRPAEEEATAAEAAPAAAAATGGGGGARSLSRRDREGPLRPLPASPGDWRG
jgi:hypothetical protein